MKISMMQVALVTAVARGIVHYPHSIADTIVNALTPITEYNHPTLSSIQMLSSQIQSKMIDMLFKDRSLSNADRDLVRVDAMRYVEDPEKYIAEVYTRLRHETALKREKHSAIEAEYCNRYFVSLFEKGDKDKDSFLELAEYKDLLQSLVDENASIWMTDDRVIDFGFSIIDHDNNEKIHVSEWTNLVSEMVPVEISLQRNGSFQGRTYVEC